MPSALKFSMLPVVAGWFGESIRVSYENARNVAHGLLLLEAMRLHEIIERAGAGEEPPPNLGKALKALWLERAGHWDSAHDLCQEIEGRDSALIHAYLHRVEGDQGNADYWYAQAGRKQPAPDREKLDEEWEDLVRIFNPGEAADED